MTPTPSQPCVLRPRRILHVAATLAILGSTRGQAPSAWADLHVPGGINPAALSANGPLVLYRDGGFMRVFSAATGRWHAHTPSPGTFVVLERDLVLTPESDRWTAFSAWRGTFAVRFPNLAPSSIVHDESVACVIDGTALHTFSAFTGQWHSRTLPAGWQVTVGPRIAVIGDLANIRSAGAAAFDVYTGQWHELPAQTARLQAMEVSGCGALLDFSLYQYGFSGLRPAWVRSAGAGGYSGGGSFNFHRGDLVLSRDMIFDALTGTILASPLPFQVSGTFSTLGMVGTIDMPVQQYACAIAHGTWILLPAGSLNAIPNSGERDAVSIHYNIAGRTIAFSAVSGTYSVANIPLTELAYGGVVAAVATTNAASVYSALTSQWHAAPGGAQPGLPVVSRTSALFATTAGVSAFSAWTGAFVPLAGSALVRHGDSAGSVVAATGNGTLHVFDARTDRWLSHPLAATSPALAFGASTLAAIDATRAVGFGARSGRLEATALPEPPLAAGAAGDVAWVRTATHLLAFTGLPDNVTWPGFPENNVVCGIGTTFRHQVRLAPGSLAIVGLGPRAVAPTPLPPFGDLWLDLGLTAFFAAVPDAGEGRSVQALPIPADTALRNTEWFLQSLVVPGTGQPFLGDPAAVRIL